MLAILYAITFSGQIYIFQTPMPADQCQLAAAEISKPEHNSESLSEDKRIEKAGCIFIIPDMPVPGAPQL